ncbi:MAG: PDDEXK nuclease domain-containing protein [Chitinispirillales bacterium]|jgi:predicted nuclease of restriction endonuclease-like (RecB) superfamily|nr:PDDEXK nuclease domain-containing protein [Chitinispirillales bacterium]
MRKAKQNPLTKRKNTNIHIYADYHAWFESLKKQIQVARTRAALAVNAELVHLYHKIGMDILQRQQTHRWGDKIIARLAVDLKTAFPDMKGFSATNLKYMRYFAEQCPVVKIGRQSAALIGQQPADQLPWFHIVTILTKTKLNDREWYAARAVAEGWSRSTLEQNIKNQLRKRQGTAITNFAKRLPARQFALAQEILKDPYNFDFLGLADNAHEREIENALIRHILQFLLELGVGFAFVGRQFRLEVDGDEFFIDLLFYHTRLKCYVVIELKAAEFKPEHTGKLNFYLTAVDEQIKAPDDRPTIGLLLCKNRKKIVAEYALRNLNSPIGIAEYQLVAALPKELKNELPSIEEIEARLAENAKLPSRKKVVTGGGKTKIGGGE